MLYEMFHSRLMLHRRAYQHKTKAGVEVMWVAINIQDKIIEAFSFEGKSGKN